MWLFVQVFAARHIGLPFLEEDRFILYRNLCVTHVLQFEVHFQSSEDKTSVCASWDRI